MNTSTTVSRTTDSTTTVPISTNSSVVAVTVRIPANATSNDTDVLNSRAVPASTLSNTTTTDPAGNVKKPKIVSAPVNLTLSSGQTTFLSNLTLAITSQTSNVTVTNPCCAVLIGSNWVCMNTSSNTTQVNGTLNANCTTNHFSTFAIIDAPQYLCTPSCPEVMCIGETYDLVSNPGNVLMGWLNITNILTNSIDFEFHTFQDNADPHFGWQLTSVYIEVGAVTYKDTFPTRYREYVNIQTQDAFPPLGHTQCWDNVQWFAAAEVTDDSCKKRNNDCTTNYYSVYAVPQTKKRSLADQTPTLPSSEPSLLKSVASKRNNGPFPDASHPVFYTHSMCCECDFRAEKQADYGRECNGGANPIGCYLASMFNFCFTSGLTVGCSAGHTMFFDSSSALQSYMDRATQPAGPLTQNYNNPAYTESGRFGGLLTSLVINDKFDRCDNDFAGSCDWLQSLYLCPPEPGSPSTCFMFFGMTIRDVISISNDYLGGCSYPPGSLSYEEVADCIDYIEINLAGGRRPAEFFHDGIQENPCSDTLAP